MSVGWPGCRKTPATRTSAQGVIAIDNVLISHEGQFIEEVGYFWDHAEKRHLIAHDYPIGNYVCTSGKHSPLEFRRFRKRKQWDPKEGPFKTHTVLFNELVDWVCQKQIPGEATFDCYFTVASILNHLQAQGRGYVGDLKFNRKVWFCGRQMRASEVVAAIGPESRKPVQVGEDRQWYFTKSMRIPDVDHPVRLVILWERKNGKEAVKMLVTNRTFWEVTRILRVYRRR